MCSTNHLAMLLRFLGSVTMRKQLNDIAPHTAPKAPPTTLSKIEVSVTAFIAISSPQPEACLDSTGNA